MPDRIIDGLDDVYFEQPTDVIGDLFLDEITAPIHVTLTDEDDRFVEGFLNQTKDGFVWGLAGDDFISTKSFGVSIFAGSGDDTILWAYQPPKLIDGGSGVDTLDLSHLPRGASVDLSAGIAKTFVPLFVGIEGVEVRGVENVVGTAFDDLIRGDGGANVLMGGDGADTIFGGGGEDEIRGGANTGGGRDILFGGADADRFIFNTAEEWHTAPNSDLIVDFEDGADLIVFESTISVGSLDFYGAHEGPGPVFSAYDSYLNVEHIPDAGGSGVLTRVTLQLSDVAAGGDVHFTSVLVAGEFDLTPGDFAFI